MTKLNRRALVGAGLAAPAIAIMPVRAQSGPIRMAFIDPLSGFMANVGDGGLKQFQFECARINAAGGMGGRQIETIGFDNKLNPQESVVQLQRAIDQGIRFITQGNGSSVASALVRAIDQHNQRNPREQVLYFNYAAVDPALTNGECSFWHFRFDADVDMKMAALTEHIRTLTNIKKVYILGQDYSFGRSFADAAVAMLKEKRPDIEVVGNELHPLARVRDFSPYITKMRQAGAEAVLTGNWGNDMTLLIKASSDAGFNVPYFTFYGGGLGAVQGMGRSAVGLVRQVTEWHANVEGLPGMDDIVRRFKAQHRDLDYYYYRVKVMFDMMKRTIDQTRSTDARVVASALEGVDMPIETGSAQMRRDNHQLIQPLYISTLAEGMKFDIDNTGLGYKTDARIDGPATARPTTCQMRRPTA